MLFRSDLSLDEAEGILAAAQAVVAMRDKSMTETEETDGQPEHLHSVSAEFDPEVEAEEVTPSHEMTDAGYDEAVNAGPAVDSDAEPQSDGDERADEILLQEPGRDLRPDTITPSPDITSSGAAALQELAAVEESAALDSENAAQTTSAPERFTEAVQGRSDEAEEKPDASPDAAS